MLINFNSSCQGTPGAPANTHLLMHTDTPTRTEICDPAPLIFFFFFIPEFDKRLFKTDGHDHECLDFLCVTQPFNTSVPTNLRHLGNLEATFKHIFHAQEKHSCGRLKPKQWKEEEIHLFSKRGVHKAAIVYCFHVRRMLAEQNRLIMLC